MPAYDPLLDEVVSHPHTTGDISDYPATTDARYVNVAGDTMTGPLINTLATGNSLVWDTNTLVVDATNHRVGIGTDAPTHQLSVTGSGWMAQSSGEALRLGNNANTTSALRDALIVDVTGTTTTRSAILLSTFTGTANTVSFFQAINAQSSTSTDSTGNLTATGAGGLRNNYIVTHRGSGTVSNMSALNGVPQCTGTGTVTNAFGLRSSVPSIGASSTITNLYSVYVQGGSITGTLTNQYGLYIEDRTVASTLNYAIYTNAGLNRLGDQLSVVGSADRIQTIIKGYSSQTANLTEWQNSSGGILLQVEADGELDLIQDSKYIRWGAGLDAGIAYDGTNMLLNPKIVGTGYLNIMGQTLVDDKIIFTQTDGNEYIDSLNDGYMDYGATTAHRFNTPVRSTTASYRRYYHLPLGSFNPGASGATWTPFSANNVNGWQLNASTETLEFDADVHSDWDGASDLKVEVYFQLLDAGSAGDTVDLKLVCRYMGVGDTATKTQTVEVATATDGTQYKMYKAEFTINYDEVGNVVDAGDLIDMELNLETDTSEIDNILITSGTFYYNTTHTGVESGDV